MRASTTSTTLAVIGLVAVLALCFAASSAEARGHDGGKHRPAIPAELKAVFEACKANAIDLCPKPQHHKQPEQQPEQEEQEEEQHERVLAAGKHHRRGPPGAKLVHCLKEHETELSTECAAAIAALPAPPARQLASQELKLDVIEDEEEDMDITVDLDENEEDEEEEDMMELEQEDEEDEDEDEEDEEEHRPSLRSSGHHGPRGGKHHGGKQRGGKHGKGRRHRTPKPVLAVRINCEQDVEDMCAEGEDAQDVIKCMERNQDELSDDCADAFLALQTAPARKPHGHGHGQAGRQGGRGHHEEAAAETEEGEEADSPPANLPAMSYDKFMEIDPEEEQNQRQHGGRRRIPHFVAPVCGALVLILVIVGLVKLVKRIRKRRVAARGFVVVADQDQEMPPATAVPVTGNLMLTKVAAATTSTKSVEYV